MLYSFLRLMPLTGATDTITTTTTMAAESFIAAKIGEQIPNHNEDNIANTSPLNVEHEFEESQCLFCNRTSPGLDHNVVHMSKAHGLHIDPANLLVDIGSLLAYFHLIISGLHECLYCGTQRNTRQAVQQHMMAKGHCKYDITDKDSELRDFYEFPSSGPTEGLRQSLIAMRSLDDAQLLSQVRSRRPRPSKRSDRNDPGIANSTLDLAPATPSPQPHTDAESSTNAAEIPSASRELSTRALKQEFLLNNQLTQLRAGDRQSLVHLPVSQQRALLATHHKQMEKARRTQQIHRVNLESAGNKFNCLDKVRLIRKPPHTGNVFNFTH